MHRCRLETPLSDQPLRRTAALLWFLLLASAALACLLYWPVGPLDTTHLPSAAQLPYGAPGGLGAFGDPVQAIWFLAWIPHAIGILHDPLRVNFLDAPGVVNLADNPSSALLGLLGAPVTLLLGPVATFNVLLRLSFVSSTLAMAVLLRSLCRRRLAVLAGSLLYGFSPYVMVEGFYDAHLDLLFVPIPPLVAWCVVRAVRDPARSVRYGLIAGALLAAQAYIAPEVTSQLVVLGAIGVAGAALLPATRRRVDWRPMAVGAATAAAALGVLCAPLLLDAVFGPGHLNGPVFAASGLQSIHADLLGPVVPTYRQLVATPSMLSVSQRFATANPTETLAYLGVPLLVVLVVLVLRGRCDRVLRWSFAFAGIGLLLSLGPELTVAGHATGVPLPEAVFEHLPLLDSTVPSRFALEVVLSCAVALARGIDRWLDAEAGRRRALPVAGLFVGLAASAFTLVPAAAPAEAPIGPTPSASLLDGAPAGSAILTYPYPKTPYDAAMLWMAVDGVRYRLIGGYATVGGPGGVGVASAPLLRPAEVQEELAWQQNGGAPVSVYQPPPPGSPTPAEVCTFVERYRVREVVVARRGIAGGRKVAQLFGVALGSASRRTNAFDVWVIPRTGCRAAP